MNTFINVFQQREGQLGQAIIAHIQISVISLFLAVIISIPLGIFLTRKEKLAEGIIGITAVLQTIPSLALLGLLIPLVGIGKIPAIIALVIYALLPILRNTYTGIKEVDPSLIEAAQAMGMTSFKRLIKVELPLALPVIMAGIRTAMVLIIGTATLAALIGAGGLGDIILLGIDRNNPSLIFLGAIPAALLAIAFDVVLRFVVRTSFKRTLQVSAISVLALILIMVLPQVWGTGSKKTFVIGAKLGAEPAILINMYKDLIEQDTNLHVELKPGLGKTTFVFNALKKGSIDMYPEFTGTALSTFLKEQAKSRDRAKVYEQVKAGMLKQFNMVMLKPMQFNDTYALAVPQSFANNYHLTTISDLKPIESKVKAGFTLEFTNRSDGYKGIEKLYGIHFANLKTMEPSLRYQAAKNGKVNVVDAYSTDSALKRYNLKVLKDNKNLFPPYQGAPLLLASTLKKYPQLKPILNQLAGKITDDQMRQMNYEVNVGGKSPASVAKAYLQQQGLLKK